MPEKLELTPQQREMARNLFSETPDLIILTRKLFNNEELDGRSNEGKAVKEFLISEGLQYRTTKKPEPEDIYLSEEQKKIILSHADEFGAIKIAQKLWPERKVRSYLSKECRVIVEFLRESAPEKIRVEESGVGLGYKPPKDMIQAIKLINDSTFQELSTQNLSSQNRQNIKSFIRFINQPRVIQIMNDYEDNRDRVLFESEYTSKVWDKPDLTADEITLYIGVCQDIVQEKHLAKMKNNLSKLLGEASESEDGKDLTVRLSENLSTVNEDIDKVRKRIESAIKKLNGDRSSRIKEQGERSSNFLAIVEAFQQEDERRRMLIIAKGKREKIKNEADRLEGLDEWKARILGVGKGDIL